MKRSKTSARGGDRHLARPVKRSISSGSLKQSPHGASSAAAAAAGQLQASSAGHPVAFGSGAPRIRPHLGAGPGLGAGPEHSKVLRHLLHAPGLYWLLLGFSTHAALLFNAAVIAHACQHANCMHSALLAGQSAKRHASCTCGQQDRCWVLLLLPSSAH